MMEWADLIKVADFAWTVSLALVAFVYWLANRRFVAMEQALASQKKELKEDREKNEKQAAERARSMGEIRDRLADIEAFMKYAPSRDDMHGLALKVADLTGDVKELGQSVSGIGNVVTRIDDYLLQQASKK